MAGNDGNQYDSEHLNQIAHNHNPNATIINDKQQYVVASSSRGIFLLPLIFSGVLIFFNVLLLLVYFLPASNSGFMVSDKEKNEAINLLEKRRADLSEGLSNFSCQIATTNPQSSDFIQGGSVGNNGRGGALNPNESLPNISGSLLVPSRGPIAHAEKATVLIMIEDDSDDGGSMGTGFFINETDILTNLHVVGRAQNVQIINKALGKTISANVIARSRLEAQIGAPDFAILRVNEGRAPAVLAIASKTAKGENVIAAGFPGIIMETDTVFHRLLRGDATAAPEVAVTQGMVTTFQQGIEGLELMLHTAAISGGNSGGPLIDYCGRAVGVNTFLRSGGAENSPLSFAQRTSTLTRFLKNSNIAFKFDELHCNPHAQQQANILETAPEANGVSVPNNQAIPTIQSNNEVQHISQPTTQPNSGENDPLEISGGNIGGDNEAAMPSTNTVPSSDRVLPSPSPNNSVNSMPSIGNDTTNQPDNPSESQQGNAQ